MNEYHQYRALIQIETNPLFLKTEQTALQDLYSYEQICITTV